MSAFLGPIHYWLYNKIQIQEEFVQNIINTSEKNNWCENLADEVEKNFGKREERNLEEIIDQNNIHGWLQSKISNVESKLAFVVTNILKKNPDYISELKKVAFSFGESKAIAGGTGADECYNILNNTLIDGMPCDRVNELIESDEEQCVWRQNICVHSDYWENIGSDISIYYELRHEIIKGMLSKSNLEFIANEDGFYVIKR